MVWSKLHIVYQIMTSKHACPAHPAYDTHCFNGNAIRRALCMEYSSICNDHSGIHFHFQDLWFNQFKLSLKKLKFFHITQKTDKSLKSMAKFSAFNSDISRYTCENDLIEKWKFRKTMSYSDRQKSLGVRIPTSTPFDDRQKYTTVNETETACTLFVLGNARHHAKMGYS